MFPSLLLRSIDVEITPEPTPEERTAILTAFARIGTDERPDDVWWREGLDEALAPGSELEP